MALAYPLLGPGSPAELLGTGRPTLVVQGGQDPFGRPDQFPHLPPDVELVEIPGANHMFATGTPNSPGEPLVQLTAVPSSEWSWVAGHGLHEREQHLLEQEEATRSVAG